MKSKLYRKLKKFLAIILAVILAVGCYVNFTDTNEIDTVEAATVTLDGKFISGKFEAEMQALGWADVTYYSASGIATTDIKAAFWKDTSQLTVRRIDDSKINSVSVSGAVGRKITSSISQIDDYVTENGSVSDNTYSGITKIYTYESVDKGEKITLGGEALDEALLDGNSDLWRSISDITTEIEFTTTPIASSLDMRYPNVLLDEEADVLDSLYYTIKYDSALGGYYRNYYVSTADQLAVLLYYYEKSPAASLKAVYKANGTGDVTENELANKIGIELLCDLDLGGKKGIRWCGYRNASYYLEIIGNGYNIYNGYFNNVINDVTYTWTAQDVTSDDSDAVTTAYAEYAENIDTAENAEIAATPGDAEIELADVQETTANIEVSTTGNYGQFGAFLGYDTYFPDSSGKVVVHPYSDNKFAIHDVSFCNMYIDQAIGMFGNAAYAYFNNINWEHCLGAGSENTYGSYGLVFRYSYSRCYLKDCTISNSYMIGKAHCALFASYNGTSSFDPNNLASYIGDTDSDIKYWYYTDIPESVIKTDSNGTSDTIISDSVEAVELTWASNNYVKDDNGNYNVLLPTTYMYPSIFENCATIDSEVYDIGTNHSGTFVSCIQSRIIFKNCFSNCTIYAKMQLGVFTGACIGCSDGFYYPYNGEKTFVNTYFENCFTFGSIEGNSSLGGFIGMIYDDPRAYNRMYPQTAATKYRGQVVFKNCYSTSSVGMEYSGQYVGGFVGLVRGNIQGDPGNDYSEKRRHIFENCYAAGEVGGISTDTSVSNANTSRIGGFIGAYANFVNSVNNNTSETVNDTMVQPISEGNNTITLINCYYDKQTTAMRERDVGYFNSSMGALAGTLDGLTGVYTQFSELKETDGLTDTVDMDNENEQQAWTHTSDEYYPQLLTFTKEPVRDSYPDGLIGDMQYNRQLTYYYYSLASTATVLLDHYDYVLGTDGISTKADETIYDTVRDITKKFDFTSEEEVQKWEINEDKNTNSDFYTYFGGDNGFSVTYDADEFDIDGSDYTRTFTPYVLTIAQVDGVWKCLDFAPGKTWVTVTTGNGVQTGIRNLRLLPTAYLNAGNIMNINVSEETTDDNDTQIINTVTVNGDNNDAITLTKYNHAVGVAYAITDKNRMDDTTVYGNQLIEKYSSSMVQNKTAFAFSNTYQLNKDDTSNPLCVGLDSSGKMFAQKFTNSEYDNNSTDGMTMVRVYKAVPVAVESEDGSNGYTLERGTEITDSATLAKWQGSTPFTDVDLGYYYMVYYWRLNDGRYLEDAKLVRISSNQYSVEIITGILGKKHTVTDSGTTPIDMYVTSGTAADEKPYPSAEESFTADNASDFYNVYNDTLEHNGDAYYIKSNKIVTGTQTTEVGWYRSPEYKITSLIVEAQDSTGVWHEMARIDEPTSSSVLSFDNAEYQYQYTTYNVTQDNVTKLFTVTSNDSRDVSFKVVNSSTTLEGISQNISFDFSADAAYSDFNDNLRVTVLFRENEADISGEKTVLIGETELNEPEADTYSDTSFAEDESYKEVDDTGITGDIDRKAVISGDILTYRIKLHNTGYIDSSEVNVYDVVPDGCTYRDGTMKIYRQETDFTSSSAKYGPVYDVTEETGFGISSSTITSGEDKGKLGLTWNIPKIELNYDYYVEYQVEVDDIAASDEKRLLTNTAVWEFISLNGNTDDSSESTSVDAYIQHAIFDMDVDVDDDTEERTYTIYFEQADNDTYSNISFTNAFSQGFTYNTDIGIKLYKKTGEDPDTGEEEYEEVNVGDTYDIGLSVETDKFTLSGFNLAEGDKYKVVFSGTQKTLGIEDGCVNEIKNVSRISYKKTMADGTTEEYANAITKTERMTNQVETDVTWLYLNIEKIISTDDTEQSFLMQIAYYEDESDAEPDIYYTRINCTEDVLNDAGSTIGYKGNQIVQCGRRGIYVVTEITDWSDTDYDFGESKYADIAIYQSTGSLIYPSGVERRNGKMVVNENSVTFSMPRLMYESGAFPTSFGTDTQMPTAAFYNDESEYAYLSGQSYSENNINK